MDYYRHIGIQRLHYNNSILLSNCVLLCFVYKPKMHTDRIWWCLARDHSTLVISFERTVLSCR